MSPDAIAALLAPYLGDDRLSGEQLSQFATYLDLLLRWNARTNLTAVREPENIVSRHFGESLFAARHLFPSSGNWQPATGNCSAADLGSGAGFPGLPLKIWAPTLRITLIESQNKKATFLREVIRALQLKEAEVFCGRAEDLGGPRKPSFGLSGEQQIANHESQIANGFDVVTLRAVERFESALQVAIRLVSPGGRLALLIGEAQAETARNHARQLQWSEPFPIPLSSARILLIGRNHSQQEPHQ